MRRSDDDAPEELAAPAPLPVPEPERLPEPEIGELLLWLEELEDGVELGDAAEAAPEVELPGPPRLLLWLGWPLSLWMVEMVLSVLTLPETLELPERLISVEIELLLEPGLSTVPLAETEELDEPLGVADSEVLIEVLL